MKSDRPENLSRQALEVEVRYRRLPPEAQREFRAFMDALSLDAEQDATHVILEQRLSGEITGTEATRKLEVILGRARLVSSRKRPRRSNKPKPVLRLV